MKGHKVLRNLLAPFDRVYLALDKWLVRRTRNLHWIPDLRHRCMGRNSYAEWAHVIGIFQALMQHYLPTAKPRRILDVGCGTGALGIAAAACLDAEDRYTGIDVMEDNVAFCRRHFAVSDQHEFLYLDVHNPTYGRSSKPVRPWDIVSESIDLVTALSVWTHLNESDAQYYMREIDRVLRPGGIGLVTFFALDEEYERSLSRRGPGTGRFHRTRSDRWVFDVPCSPSGQWFHPAWVEHPEDAIAVSMDGIDWLIRATELELERHYPGNWKERPGLYFQDVMVFRKKAASPLDDHQL